MKKTLLLIALLSFLTDRNQAQTLIDIDGNVYNTVTIGTQTWMKENLKVTHYNNNDSIHHATDFLQWMYSTSGAYCSYYYGIADSSNEDIYGNLYNWNVIIDTRNVCPEGWHVPSLSDWGVLIDTLGGTDWAGMRLKESDTIHWNSPNPCANNESGFTALPGGFCDTTQWFTNLHLTGVWWTSNEYDLLNSWSINVNLNCCGAYENYFYKKGGVSIRCIKNSTNEIKDENNTGNYIHIYPTPATDRIVIDYSNIQISFVSIYNIVGELLLQQDLTKNKNEIDISNLSKGIYIIRLVGNNWTGLKKIIKE